jgi:hypothetical protein
VSPDPSPADSLGVHFAVTMAHADRSDAVTPELRSSVEAGDAAQLVDVVVELEPAQADTTTVDDARAAFERDAGRVASTITELGGEVTGRVWLNRTLRARVPSKRLDELSGHAEISGLDVPRALRPE